MSAVAVFVHIADKIVSAVCNHNLIRIYKMLLPAGFFESFGFVIPVIEEFYLAVQDFLRRKAAGEKPANSEYKDVTTKQKSTAAAFSRSYNDLSVAYADYIQRRSEEA